MLILLLALLAQLPSMVTVSSAPRVIAVANVFPRAAFPLKVDFKFPGRIFAGDTATARLLLINENSSDILVDSIPTSLLINGTGGPVYHKLIGNTTNFIVTKGDTVQILLEVSAAQPGFFQVGINTRIRSESYPIAWQVDAYPTHPFWHPLSTVNLSGCERDVTSEMMILHYKDKPAFIDSVVARTEGWYLPQPFVNQPVLGDTIITILVGRRKYTMDHGIFILYPRGEEPDTLQVTLNAHVFKPRMLPEVDTTYIDLLPDQTEIFVLTAKNVGYGTYRLRPAEYTGSNAWSVEPIDTNQLVLVSATAQVFLRFTAQTEDGDYPITVTLRPDVCDTSMTKTVIARVRRDASVQSPSVTNFKIWPQAEPDRIRITSEAAFEYQLLDILGIVRMTGIGAQGINEIILHTLVPGTYILTCRNGDEYFARSVSVVR